MNIDQLSGNYTLGYNYTIRVLYHFNCLLFCIAEVDVESQLHHQCDITCM